MPSPLLLLSLSLLLAGCCVAERCECPNQAVADAIGLRFSRDTLGAAPTGFTRFETARLLLIRRPIDSTGGARTEQVYLADHLLPADGAADVLLRRQGLFPTSTLGLNAYTYEVILLRKPGRPALRRYQLTDVQLEARYVTTTSCCTCYENARKQARLNGGPLLDLYTPPGAAPAIIELRK